MYILEYCVVMILSIVVNMENEEICEMTMTDEIVSKFESAVDQQVRTSWRIVLFSH